MFKRRPTCDIFNHSVAWEYYCVESEILKHINTQYGSLAHTVILHSLVLLKRFFI